MSRVTLPDRPDALRAVDEGRANPVEVFVAGWEYTGSDPTIRAAWCSQLLDALESVRGADVEIVEMVNIVRLPLLSSPMGQGIDERVRLALDALDIPAIKASAYRAGMEAMREKAATYCKENQTLYTEGRVAMRAAALMIRALPLDPAPASAMAGGEAAPDLDQTSFFVTKMAFDRLKEITSSQGVPNEALKRLMKEPSNVE